MDVKNEVEEDNLAADFDRALSETMANKGDDDREVGQFVASALAE